MNMTDHPWDTDSGGILAPGQSGEAGDSERVRDAVRSGQLRATDGGQESEPTPAALGQYPSAATYPSGGEKPKGRR